uniref:RNA polymerase-associated protein CTR9 n=1 Tax=Meloidogyne javanica TaxID=6303 RepID=A0A915NCG6_MELJA
MSSNYQQKTVIVIPLRDSTEDEIIEINFNELPEGDEVLQILKSEKAALHFWLDLALEYYKQGMVQEFVKILELSGGEAGLEYPDYERDQMRALDMLAAHYVLMNHLLGRAYFCLLEGNKVEQADAQFSFVMNQAQMANDGRVIPAMMGKACIAFNKKEYKTALQYYKRCLRLNPNAPADVRVGMGYCFARLGRMDKARLAFERALQLDSKNVPSIVALAVLDLNIGTPEGIRSGIQALGLAYHHEPENPMVLNHLANHFFYKQDVDKTFNLAQVAHQLADNDLMRAESMYHMARCYHKKLDYQHAFQFYYQATTLCHLKFVLPYYGLGLIYIHREDYENAISAFEKILKTVPNDLDTLAVLGSLYVNVQHKDPKICAERREKAREYLKKVVESQTDKPPIEALIELAQLLEQLNPQESLQLYLRVASLLKEEIGVDIPAEILNNIGSLHFMLNELDESKKYFQEARDHIVSEGMENLNDEAAALLITISYNLGRVNEQLCLLDEAEKLYRDIIQQRPNYMDCILRLGCLIRDKGDLHNASMLFKESMSVNPTHPDPWTLIGNMHMAKEEWGPGQKKFEHILKLTNNTDVYSFVALGNIWLEMLFSSKTREKDALYRDRALSYYTRVIKLRPHNIWAANGVGCVLAHKGAFLDARDIFSQVREATADFPDVWINIAHIYMEQKQYVSALQMYKNCMTKFDRNNDIQLMGYIARAYWKAGKIIECREYIEKILKEEPDKLVHQFNHAVVLQRMATQVLKDIKSNLEAVTNAVEDLKVAERTFKSIASTQPEIVAKAKYISRTICANEAQSCTDLTKQAKVYLERAQQKDEEERRQKAIQEEQRQRILKQQQEEESQKRPARVSTHKKRKEGGEAEDFVNDSSDLGEYDDELHATSSRRKLKRRHRERGGEESEEEEDDTNVGRKSKISERRRAEREDEMVPARQRGKIKSKAFLSSSSSSSSPSPTRRTEGQSPSGDEEEAVQQHETEDTKHSASEKENEVESDREEEVNNEEESEGGEPELNEGEEPEHSPSAEKDENESEREEEEQEDNEEVE